MDLEMREGSPVYSTLRSTRAHAGPERVYSTLRSTNSMGYKSNSTRRSTSPPWPCVQDPDLQARGQRYGVDTAEFGQSAFSKKPESQNAARKS